MKFSHIFGMICFGVGIFIIETYPLGAISLAGVAILINIKEINTFLKEL